jgi:hypothetical protein
MNYGYPCIASGRAIALAGGGAPRHGYPRTASGLAIAPTRSGAPRQVALGTASGFGNGAARKRCFSATITPYRLPLQCDNRLLEVACQD